LILSFLLGSQFNSIPAKKPQFEWIKKWKFSIRMNMNSIQFVEFRIWFELELGFNSIHAKTLIRMNWKIKIPNSNEYEYIQWIWIWFEYFQFELTPYFLSKSRSINLFHDMNKMKKRKNQKPFFVW